ncbi:ABC transporter F family member 3 [Vitis vinifera]|uniref:ABC transporter F family member 3 n=1 Tax=Vitis vinifera TaxID=29760 RepID=A0A438I4S3_VITVI|nr:ABC transporter F family member 3 [Vitis vinifera]
MTEVASSVIHEVLGRRALDVDQPIIDYIVNVLADDDFDSASKAKAPSTPLENSSLTPDASPMTLNAALYVCSILCEKFGKHGLVKPKPAVRSLAAPLRMFDGMDEEEVPKKKPEVTDGPILTERDRAKLERRKRKDERQREQQYQMHLAEMEAAKAGMPVVCVNHDNSSGPAIKDIHLENFNISIGGRDLIVDGSVTLSYGRHYGLVGRNGTGKTTFLRYMAMHAIDGIPKNCQILHVEQEVVGDDISALQCVLNTDIERTQLLEEEAHLLAQQRELEFEGATGKSQGELNGDIDKDVVGKRLEEIYKRLEFIDAYSAESRAGSILAMNHAIKVLLGCWVHWDMCLLP